MSQVYLSFGGLRALAGPISVAAFVDPEPHQGSSVYGLKDAALIQAKAASVAKHSPNQVYVFTLDRCFALANVDAKAYLVRAAVEELRAYGHKPTGLQVSAQHKASVKAGLDGTNPLILRLHGAEVDDPLLVTTRYLAEGTRLHQLADIERSHGFPGLVASLGNKTEQHLWQLMSQPPTPEHDHEACRLSVAAFADAQRLAPPDWLLSSRRRPAS